MATGNLATIKITSNGVLLPSPIALEVNRELIWSSNTGRSISASDAGLMIGDVVANKKTVHIEWGILTQTEFNTITANMPNGFFPFQLTFGATTESLTVYHGTIEQTVIASPDGNVYYTAKVDVIEQ